jgi:preprotein translocase subunit SecG
MYTFLLVVHILIAIVLVIVVLVQSGKGGGLGAGFGGGGANTLFGSSGGGNFFTKLTMCLAAGFMVTSLGLTVTKSRALKTSIFDQNTAGQAPTEPGIPAAAPAPVPPASTGTPAAPVAPAAPGTPPVAPKADTKK